MNGEGSVTQWLYALKQGDSASAQQLWNRYFERLVALAERKLRGRHPAADAEDVVLCAMASFFVRARAGRFPSLTDRTELWPLLVKITACKAYNELEREGAQKRGGFARRGPGALEVDEGSVAEQLARGEPSPEFAAQVAEECGRLLGLLDDPRLVRIAELKLEGFSNGEIAAQLDVCERTIERKLNRIRARWSEESPP
jgi:DNA-directed RNA polymerase specialized sigma24 family protein